MVVSDFYMALLHQIVIFSSKILHIYEKISIDILTDNVWDGIMVEKDGQTRKNFDEVFND